MKIPQKRPAKEFFSQIPIYPGCYLYKNADGKIIYIGKALNLRNRVRSYFSNQKAGKLDPKTELMMRNARSIDYIIVDSEVEALILETNLIKKYRPKYNRRMIDDKNYIYVMFDNSVEYPKPKIVREKSKKSATYFGPYPNTFPARQVLRRLRKLFPYCNSNFTKPDKGGRPCLDYHIGLCSGVCAGLISKTQHRKNINKIKQFFRGKKRDIFNNLSKQMDELSKKKNFEEAAKVRDQLRDLEYVTQRIKIDTEIDDKNLNQAKQEYNIRALDQLLMRIKIAPGKVNFKKYRIECYDISNIQGKHATGSMVVFVGGKSAKKEYRKFKIKTKDTPDDFGMMQEVLERRFENDFAKPDLVVIDGGKGQLSSADKILSSLNLSEIALIGLAKREEEIFRLDDDGERFKKTILPRRSPALYLIQRIRDEAHRFAIGYHRQLRGKASTKSALDDIPGVGKLTKKRLIKAFGSVPAIRKAKKSELQTVIKNMQTVEAIQKVLR